MTLPSVTRVLAPFADFSRIKPEVLAHAAQRGTAVHAACAAHAQSLWVPRLDPEVQPYFDSFRRWFDAMVVDVIAIEFEVVDGVLGYCGHPDFAGRIKGDSEASVVDWKTPAAKQRTWPAQIAAYMNGFEKTAGTPAMRGGSLRLKKNGGRAIFNEITAMERRQNFAYFLGALTAYRGFVE